MRFHMRVARPTNALEPLVAFYRDLVGFEVVASFEDHEGFDGVILGHQGLSHHIEFTYSAAHPAPPCPSPEHLLAFYADSPEQYAAIKARFAERGVAPVAALNPYWDTCGTTYADPDGYRVVFVEHAWEGA